MDPFTIMAICSICSITIFLAVESLDERGDDAKKPHDWS